MKLCRYKIESSQLNRHSQTMAIFQNGTSVTNIEINKKKMFKKKKTMKNRNSASAETMQIWLRDLLHIVQTYLLYRCS